MTGWRVGWAVLPEQAISAIDRLSQNMFISAPAIPNGQPFLRYLVEQSSISGLQPIRKIVIFFVKD